MDLVRHSRGFSMTDRLSAEDLALAGKAECGCVHHVEEGIPCEHDLALRYKKEKARMLATHEYVTRALENVGDRTINK